MIKQWMQRIVVTSCVAVALGLSSGRLTESHSSDDLDQDDHQREETLYIWAGDQERKRPDFLAVIDFDEHSHNYGRVLRTVPLPPPGHVATSRTPSLSSPTKTSWPAAGYSACSQGRMASSFLTSRTLGIRSSSFRHALRSPALPMTSCPCPAGASWSCRWAQRPAVPRAASPSSIISSSWSQSTHAI